MTIDRPAPDPLDAAAQHFVEAPQPARAQLRRDPCCGTPSPTMFFNDARSMA